MVPLLFCLCLLSLSIVRISVLSSQTDFMSACSICKAI